MLAEKYTVKPRLCISLILAYLQLGIRDVWAKLQCGLIKVKIHTKKTYYSSFTHSSSDGLII